MNDKTYLVAAPPLEKVLEDRFLPQTSLEMDAKVEKASEVEELSVVFAAVFWSVDKDRANSLLASCRSLGKWIQYRPRDHQKYSYRNIFEKDPASNKSSRISVLI